MPLKISPFILKSRLVIQAAFYFLMPESISSH